MTITRKQWRESVETKLHEPAYDDESLFTFCLPERLWAISAAHKTAIPNDPHDPTRATANTGWLSNRGTKLGSGRRLHGANAAEFSCQVHASHDLGCIPQLTSATQQRSLKMDLHSSASESGLVYSLAKKPIAASGLPGARARACLRNCIRRRRRFTAESVRENRTTHRRGRGRASPSVAGNSAHPGTKAERMRLRLHCRIPQTLDRALPLFVPCGVNRRGVELQSKQTRRDFWIR